jgi:hypothetical protein
MQSFVAMVAKFQAFWGNTICPKAVSDRKIGPFADDLT